MKSRTYAIIAAIFGSLANAAQSFQYKIADGLSATLKSAGFRSPRDGSLNGRRHTGTAAVKRAARKRRAFLKQHGRLK